MKQDTGREEEEEEEEEDKDEDEDETRLDRKEENSSGEVEGLS